MKKLWNLLAAVFIAVQFCGIAQAQYDSTTISQTLKDEPITSERLYKRAVALSKGLDRKGQAEVLADLMQAVQGHEVIGEFEFRTLCRDVFNLSSGTPKEMELKAAAIAALSKSDPELALNMFEELEFHVPPNYSRKFEPGSKDVTKPLTEAFKTLTYQFINAWRPLQDDPPTARIVPRLRKVAYQISKTEGYPYHAVSELVFDLSFSKNPLDQEYIRALFYDAARAYQHNRDLDNFDYPENTDGILSVMRRAEKAFREPPTRNPPSKEERQAFLNNLQWVVNHLTDFYLVDQVRTAREKEKEQPKTVRVKVHGKWQKKPVPPAPNLKPIEQLKPWHRYILLSIMPMVEDNDPALYQKILSFYPEAQPRTEAWDHWDSVSWKQIQMQDPDHYNYGHAVTLVNNNSHVALDYALKISDPLLRIKALGEMGRHIYRSDEHLDILSHVYDAEPKILNPTPLTAVEVAIAKLKIAFYGGDVTNESGSLGEVFLEAQKNCEALPAGSDSSKCYQPPCQAMELSFDKGRKDGVSESDLEVRGWWRYGRFNPAEIEAHLLACALKGYAPRELYDKEQEKYKASHH